MSTKMPKEVSLPTSIRTRSNLPLGGTTVTTMDFGVTNVGYFREVKPTDHISGRVSTFVQLAPMVVPTFGSATLHSRAFFVPYRFIWNSWEDFASNKSYSKSTPLQGVPYINAWDFCYFFFPYAEEEVPSIGYKEDTYEVISSSNAKDFVVGFVENPQNPENVDSAAVRLTPYGRDCYSILRSIGYTVAPFAESVVQQYVVNYKISALPLLALVKIFRDYYCNPNYDYREIDSLLSRNGTVHINYVDLKVIFDFIRYCWYDADVFTSAWAQPEQVGYTQDYYKTIEIVNEINHVDSFDELVLSPDSALGNLVTSLFETPYQENDISVTQQGLNILKAVRNIVMRQNAAGGRYIDQMLSKYGIRLPVNEARRSQFIGYADSKLNISRVDATAAGQGNAGNTSSLGDFVGRGTMSGDGSFNFENDSNDFGCIFVINHIIPDTHYYQGENPELLHLSLTDFWNGDLETTANAPIPYSAVYGQYTQANQYLRDKANDYIRSNFGYSANYWENKVGRDILSGDFLLGSRNTELESFHMFRKLSPASSLSDQDNAAVLSSEFQRMTDGNVESYSKIFNETSNFNCHFIVRQDYDVNFNSPCYSLQETMVAELKEHGNDVGPSVRVRPNGQYF